jgi:tetratricopeptide (TPR) repeat protein
VQDAELYTLAGPDPEDFYHESSIVAYCGKKEVAFRMLKRRHCTGLLRIFRSSVRPSACEIARNARVRTATVGGSRVPKQISLRSSTTRLRYNRLRHPPEFLSSCCTTLFCGLIFSRYAPAYAGLADAYFALGIDWGIPGHSEGETLMLAKTAVAKALELDPGLAEAHVSHVWGLLQDWNWQEAEKEARLVVTQNPNYAEGHSTPCICQRWGDTKKPSLR